MSLSTLQRQFQQLDHWLSHYATLWQPEPFKHPQLAWEADHPALAQWLRQLSDHDTQRLEQDQQARQAALLQYLPDLQQLHCASQLTPQQSTQLSSSASTNTATIKQELPSHFNTGIPGRKWQQSLAFSHALPRVATPLLDWCCGKGHLTRIISWQHNISAIGLEWNRQLCEAGNQLASQQQLDIKLLQQDVLSDDKGSQDALANCQQAVALHACGDLHNRLLHQACGAKTPMISIAPCCYHLIASEHYQPLSTRASTSELLGLGLKRDHLRLAVQETVTAPRGDTRRRLKLNQWRLGLDALLHTELKQSDYLPVASLSKQLLHGSFKDFCLHVADLKHLPLASVCSDWKQQHWDDYQQQGAERLQAVQRLEILRHHFRRPLELWLALDRALLLEEHGYRVSLSEFCARQLTPRNLLLHAERIAP